MQSQPTRSFESAADSLSQRDVERFSRQIILEGVGAAGMERIKRSSVLCIGAGGLGSTVALYLAAAGVGKLLIVDGDCVEVSNLHRQIIHNVDSIGVNKANSARDSCIKLHPFTKVEAHPVMLDSTNADSLMRRCDVVVDCSDNVAARYVINDFAMHCEIPVVSGSAMRWEGQLSVYGCNGGPCYRCLFPTPPPREAVSSCNDTGVLGPVPGMIGCLQATETLKMLAGVGTSLSGKMFLFDGFSFTTRVITLRQRNPHCAACGVESHLHRPLCGSSSPDAPPSELPVEYSMTSCGACCQSDIPVENRSSPVALVTMKGENKKMMVAALSTCSQLPTWRLCLDVRATNQYEMAHLPHTVSLPYSTLSQWDAEGQLLDQWNDFLLSTLLLDIMHHSQLEDVSALLPPTCQVYLICRRGINSAKATDLLLRAIRAAPQEKVLIEFNIQNVEGGLNDYHKKIDSSFPYY